VFDHSVVLRQLTVQEVEYESIARIICLGIAVLAAGLYLVTAGGVRANAAGKKDLTVTGCLQKGDEANEFSITGEDGKSYDLTSLLRVPSSAFAGVGICLSLLCA